LKNRLKVLTNIYLEMHVLFLEHVTISYFCLSFLQDFASILALKNSITSQFRAIARSYTNYEL